jgi:predicted glutamine amidotransferase
MCGLVGVLGAASARVNRHVFQDMLCMGVRRGPHSTGIVAANRKHAYLIKDTTLPWELLRTKDYHENVVGKNWYALMGHNRWATMGKVNAQNAHPFWHDHVMLMHNGTLEADKVDTLPGWNDFETDSEVIAHNIAKNGIKDTYKQLAGAWTLVWWDQKEGALFAVSNGMRPFNFILSDDKKTMYYSSEEWNIRMACEGRGVKLEKNAWTLTAHRLYKFYSNKAGKIDFDTAELETRPYVPFTYPARKGGVWVNTPNGWKELDEELTEGEDDQETFWGLYPKSSASAHETTTTSQHSKTNGTSTTGAGSDKIVPFKEDIHIHRRTYPYGPAIKLFKDEATYKAAHKESHCVLCGSDVTDEYTTALVLDPETMACGTCHSFCDLQQPKIKLT